MNLFKIRFHFGVDFERTHGTSILNLDIVAQSEESAVLKAERTLPPIMKSNIKKTAVTNG